MLSTTVWTIILVTSVSGLQICDDLGTTFTIGDKNYNVNHLKSHLPPHQSYSEVSNIFGKHEAEKSLYVFFNIADVIYDQKIDNDHKIESNCQPRSVAQLASVNTPVACIPEPDPTNNCIDKKFCWVAIGSCLNVTYENIDAAQPGLGINIFYTGGDVQGQKFQVKINCCNSGNCLDKTGLDTPAKLMNSGCANDANFCVELSSPYGCDCNTRAVLDTSLGKTEFHCDATPKGLDHGISVGTMFLLFLCAGIIAYLCIGMGYNYSEGRRGEEMIPHLDMWKDLGGLIYDGFRYVTSCGEYRAGVQYDTIG